jgi:hypothetical protein
MATKPTTKKAEPTKTEATAPTPAPAPKQDAVKFTELPLISALPKREMRDAKELFLELEGLEYCLDPDSGQMVPREERAKAIKEQLGQLQEANDLQGMRYGDFAFRMQLCSGRSSLDQEALKLALVEAGVKLEVVSKCFHQATRTGADYYTRTFKRIVK